MNDCIFCKLANGDIPTRTVYEDEEFRAIFDAAPAVCGHTLILPKKHAANLLELDEETAGKAFILGKKIAAAMKESLKCDGVNLIQNNGAAAGQTVMHFHLHVVPRYEGERSIEPWKPIEVSDEEKEAALKKLSEALK